MDSASEQKTSQGLVPHRLRPISPKSVSMNRYDRTTCVEPNHTRIEAGPFTEPEPPYLPLHWSAYTHPEGQTYFYRGSRLRIVTEAYLYRPDVLATILGCEKQIEELILEKNIVLGDSVELLLQIDEDASCGYYFIDHSTRTTFWLDEVSTVDFYILSTMSTSHLRLALEELYWNHVEYFPMHVSIPRHSVDELIGILIHARVDGITSDTSTFPYTAEKCGQFVELLKTSRDDVSMGFITCSVARLWVVIANYRFTNHHHQEVARLSRNQSILGQEPYEPNWFSIGTSRLLFGIPDTYRAYIEDIYVDNMLHCTQWSSFTSKCIDEWKLSLSWAFPLLITQVLLFIPRGTSQILAISSILTTSLSILSGILLITRLGTLREASDGAEYLTSIRSSTMGYHPIAVAFSLPKALCLWSLILLISQTVVLTLHVLHPGAAIGVGILVLLFIKGITRMMWPHSEACSLYSYIFRSLSWRKLSPELDSKV